MDNHPVLPHRFRLTSKRMYRVLEGLPGVFVWSTLILSVCVSIFFPLWAIAFIVLFDVFWLVRVLYTMSYLVIAYRQYRLAEKVHWQQRLEQRSDWQTITHVVLLPTYGESEEILTGTLNSLRSLEYPAHRLWVVLATEGREGERIRPIAHRLEEVFANVFHRFIVTEHPGTIAGEVAGKGANAAWAGKKLREQIDQECLSYDSIIVSTFDADAVAHPQYFSYLTYTFLTHPNPLRTSYQPIPLFHNNVWDAIPFMRVVAASTTIWLLGDAARPERLLTFSSHSMPWRALVDVDFWQTDVVSEDSRISLQCMMHYDGKYDVTPMFIPISMDTVQAPTLWRSFVNQYKQIRRWAYGSENFAYMVWNFLPNAAMSKRKKWRLIWNQLEGTYSWATAPIIISIMGWLPFHVGSTALDVSVLAHNAPLVTQRLLLGAMIGLILSATISVIMLPKPPRPVAWYSWALMVLQWLALPVTMIAFGSLPAIEAQTRLMLGKYLGFWVTEKSRG